MIRPLMLFLAGFATYYWFRRLHPHVDVYAMRGTPPEWTGPRYRHWKNGIEIRTDSNPENP